MEGYGHQHYRTDEYGNPVYGYNNNGYYDGQGGHVHPGYGDNQQGYGQQYGDGYGTGGRLRRSGSSSSSSEDDGYGGRRKKGLKDKIMEKLPGRY